MRLVAVAASKPGSQPKGQEFRVDPATGKRFCIDHDTRNTSWVSDTGVPLTPQKKRE